jgi:hypothetical protein
LQCCMSVIAILCTEQMVSVVSIQPFKVSRHIVLDGGGLKQPWSLEETLKYVDGQEFLPLRAQDRKLAQALGLEMKKTAPFAGNSLLACLVSARDAHIDNLIRMHCHASDPMGDAEVVTTESPLKPNRSQARAKTFVDAGVPSIIPITIPPIIGDDGQTLFGSFTLDVLSTHKRSQIVSVLFNATNMEHLAGAIQAHWQLTSDGQPELDGDKLESLRKDELPTLRNPNCRYRWNHGWKICCKYRKVSGEFSTHFEKALPHVSFDDHDVIERNVREVENRVQSFHDANHVPLPLDADDTQYDHDGDDRDAACEPVSHDIDNGQRDHCGDARGTDCEQSHGESLGSSGSTS